MPDLDLDGRAMEFAHGKRGENRPKA